MTLQELFGVIQKTLAEQGFRLSKVFQSSATACYFTLEDELEIRPISPTVSYTAVYGNVVAVKKTAHRNGAKDDTSYYLQCETWNRSAYHINEIVKKVKLMKSQTDVTIKRKVEKFCLAYKKYLADLELEKKIDELLK